MFSIISISMKKKKRHSRQLTVKRKKSSIGSSLIRFYAWIFNESERERNAHKLIINSLSTIVSFLLHLLLSCVDNQATIEERPRLWNQINSSNHSSSYRFDRRDGSTSEMGHERCWSFLSFSYRWSLYETVKSNFHSSTINEPLKTNFDQKTIRVNQKGEKKRKEKRKESHLLGRLSNAGSLSIKP